MRVASYPLRSIIKMYDLIVDCFARVFEFEEKVENGLCAEKIQVFEADRVGEKD